MEKPRKCDKRIEEILTTTIGAAIMKAKVENMKILPVMEIFLYVMRKKH